MAACATDGAASGEAAGATGGTAARVSTTGATSRSGASENAGVANAGGDAVGGRGLGGPGSSSLTKRSNFCHSGVFAAVGAGGAQSVHSDVPSRGEDCQGITAPERGGRFSIVGGEKRLPSMGRHGEERRDNLEPGLKDL